MLAEAHLAFIDGTGSAPVPDAIVVIEGDKITAAGPASSVTVPTGARALRLPGKTVLPGLIDTHAYQRLWRRFGRSAKAYLKFGVTTVFDIAGNPFLEQQKAALASGKIQGPRLFGVKYGITQSGAHPMGLLEEYKLVNLLGPVYPLVTTVDQAKAAIAKIAADKTDGVKIFYSRSAFPGTTSYDSDKEKLSRAVLSTLIEEAHAKGLRVFGHIAWPSEAREFVEAGGDVLAHNISMAETGAEEVYQLMAQRNAVLIPTLAQAEANYALMIDPYALEKLRRPSVGRDPRQHRGSAERGARA
jgi:imidazolonepropionase-like amidohydrolase